MRDHLLVSLALSDLDAVCGGAGPSYQGTGTSTKTMCFDKLARSAARTYGLTGPYRPRRRSDDHLILDQDRNRAGVATWSPEYRGSLAGACKITID